MDQKNFRNSRTAINLAKAFVGESQARNRYTIYAEIAKEQGYPTLEQVFLETGDNERGHAEVFYNYLAEGANDVALDTEVSVSCAKGSISDNLHNSAKNEYAEWSGIYLDFAQAAKQEGFNDIAESFLSIADVERRHDMRFRDLLTRYNANMLFKADRAVIWECTNCGYRLKETVAPEICPACKHKQRYFKISCETTS